MSRLPEAAKYTSVTTKSISSRASIQEYTHVGLIEQQQQRNQLKVVYQHFYLRCYAVMHFIQTLKHSFTGMHFIETLN